MRVQGARASVFFWGGGGNMFAPVIGLWRHGPNAPGTTPPPPGTVTGLRALNSMSSIDVSVRSTLAPEGALKLLKQLRITIWPVASNNVQHIQTLGWLSAKL